jgi:hypothetical protein
MDRFVCMERAEALLMVDAMVVRVRAARMGMVNCEAGRLQAKSDQRQTNPGPVQGLEAF